jgi:FMN phosphatase YigB (HAD superfamily)
MANKDNTAAANKDLSNIKLVIADVDCTLALPFDKSFYATHQEKLLDSIQKVYGVDREKAKEVRQFYKDNFNRGEYAVFWGDASTYFPELPDRKPDFKTNYDDLCTISPVGHFPVRPEFVKAVRNIRDKNIKVVLLSNSTDVLVDKMLTLVGFDVKNDFDGAVAFTAQTGPIKMLDAKAAFKKVAAQFNTPYDQILSIGDTYGFDIKPAMELGMKTCMVENEPPAEYKGLKAKGVPEASQLLLKQIP